MFTGFPVYPRYRALKLKSPAYVGEDVYALQTALVYLGYPLPQFGADGSFGKECDHAVRDAQSHLGLTVDGIAGQATQTALVRAIESSEAFRTGVPAIRLFGQTSHESGNWVGNYSPIRADDSFDAGVAQENTKLTPAKEGFDTPKAIAALADRVRHYYDLFVGLPTDRRWDLAQGAWNAPAFACYIAKEEGATKVPTNQTARPSAGARATFEAYVASVSAFA